MSIHATPSPRAAYYARFSDAEYRRRWTALEAQMDAHGVGGLMAYGSRNAGTRPIFYLSNWVPTRECFLLVPRDGTPTLVVQLQNHVQCAADMSIVDDVRFGGRGGRGEPDSVRTVCSVLREHGLDDELLGLVGDPPVAVRARLAEALPRCRWLPLESGLSELMARKSEEEIARLRMAAQVTDGALSGLGERLWPGMAEHDIVALLEQGCRAGGGDFGIRHVLATSMHDPECGVPAQYPSGRPVEVGDVVVVELSGRWAQYSAQALRTFAVGTRLIEPFRRLHETAEAAFAAIEGVLRDGATVVEVQEAAMVIEDAGYTIIDDLLHGDNQSRPIVRTRATSETSDEGFTFRSGMAVVVQPNVTTRDLRSGVQFGEMVVVRDDGVERIHDLPRRVFEEVGT